MLATMLGKHTDLHAYDGEGMFFEQIEAIRAKNEHTKRVNAVIREIEQAKDCKIKDSRKKDIKSNLLCLSKKNASLVDLYTTGRSQLARDAGAERWVQKATSYIFLIDEIIRALPKAQFIFLLRNPLDIAASLKRREATEYWSRMAWGWRKGVRRARRFEAAHPESFLVVKYEELVRKPKNTFQNISRFCKIDYQKRCLKIPHVNKSKDPYEKSNSEGGLSEDRVSY